LTAADACPGILDLHEARDGFVARIRLPGGYASAATLRALADLASRFGSGSVDLTARGNVQLRGVPATEAAELGRQAALAGLLPSPAHDRARNIMASPLAGLAGHADLRRLVRALDRALLADPGLAALPGRFLFCLDDGTGRAGLSSCDVGVRRGALRHRGAPGAGLIVAGRETGLRGPATLMVGHAVAAARAFVEQRQPTPGIMRMAALPDGGAAITEALGGALGAKVADTVDRLPLGPVPDHAPTVVAAAQAAAGSEPAVPGAARVKAPLAPAVVAAAPLARLTAPQLRLLGRMVRAGDAARLTAAGRIVLPLAGPADAAVARPAAAALAGPIDAILAGPADAALARLAEAGLLVSDDHILAAVTACSGMACASSLADVRALATRVPGLAAVHWTGCARRCGLPADAAAVVATAADQFTIAGQAGAAGGTAARIPVTAAGTR
jgi:precorrin-3B synthase